ncbi:MAG: hypothetical protein QOJ42_1932 [Acidobacteriaceae bacterium]|nr:hypothetical protein [Acidobacteriaceae bacterium]MDT7812016.1 hypothetical protein [Acidobacteriaceae bacterium]
MVLLCGAPLAACAQVNTASLSGFVTDASGAADAGARVTATNEETGYVRNLATDATGFYSFQTMPIGKYTVKVEQAGFASVQDDVVLNVGEKGRQDFHLQIGSAQQTVQVQANASLLSPDDASVGTIVGLQTIQQTPLYLRNWDDLLRTVPGVQISRYTQQSGNTSAGRTGDFNVNGVHSLQNNFILDGIDNNTFSENVQELSTEASHPSVDVIQEFNVITNPYSAEYGRSPGAVVSVNTKSGTNKMHGLLFEYLRNDYFDANDFFSNRNHLRRPANHQNQFGGSIGGPIKKDKLFYFFNYEGTRITQGVGRISTVPLDNERIGDFSAATGALVGVKYPTIKDPATGLPLPNNQVPAARIDTAVAKLIALFPEPNVSTGGVIPELNNYARNAPVKDNDDNYDARMDWTPNQKDTIFGRYNYSNRTRQIPGYFGGLADGTSTSAWGNQILKAHSFVLGWTHLFSPTVVNDFRFGFLRNFSFAEQQPFSLPQTANQFVPGIPPSPQIGGGVPLTTFSNFSFLGSADFLPKKQIPQLLQYNDTVSITHGKQTLKVGVSVYGPMRNIFQDEGGTRGDLTFTGIFSGFPYADGLLGYTQSTQLTNVLLIDQRLWMASGFFEDDWKVTPKLTLNLGLRYDFATPALAGNNKMANFNPAGSGSLNFATSGSLGDRALVQPNTKNFGPRFGVSYSPDQKTVLRGGYGIYYTLFERYGSEDQMGLNPPFLVNRTAASNTQSVLTPAQGFPNGYLDPANINLNQLQSYHVRAVNPHSPTPQVQQWSLGFQREFGNAWTAEVNYVGTKSTHLDHLVDFNQPLIVNGKATTVPYPNFGFIEYTDATSYGNYNGLQASLDHRFNNGLSMRAAYTHSRSLDNAPEELESNSGGAPDGRNFAAWYGPSDFDIPHRVSLNYVYDLPFGHGKSMLSKGALAWVLGDWRTSGVYTYYSGHPFQVNTGSLNASLDPFGQATAPPNLIGKPKLVGDPDCWFYGSKSKLCAARAPGQTDAYAAAPAGVIGNVGRNTLRGPRISVFDASLLKEFPIRETANVEFRWEVFNIANTPEFGQPNGNITSGAVGQITTLSGDPRVMQFALRLSF